MTGFVSKVLRFTYSQKTIMIYEKPMKDLASCDVRAREGYTFAELLPSDHGAFARLLGTQRAQETIFQPVFDMKEVNERIRRGDRCFVCKNEEHIVGYTWFALHEPYIMEIETTLRLKEREVYAYNGYVKQEFRGKNIIEDTLVEAGRALAAKGFSNLIIAVMEWNENPQKALRKMKFSCTGYLKTGYFATFRFMVSTCKDITVSRNAGCFQFYGKVLQKLAAALSRAGAATGMWLV